MWPTCAVCLGILTVALPPTPTRAAAVAPAAKPPRPTRTLRGEDVRTDALHSVFKDFVHHAASSKGAHDASLLTATRTAPAAPAAHAGRPPRRLGDRLVRREADSALAQAATTDNLPSHQFYSRVNESDETALTQRAPMFSTSMEEMFWMNTYPGVSKDGVISVVNPLKDPSLMETIEEENTHCMQDMSIVDCMQKIGSYGIRRLHSIAYYEILRRRWTRPDWMKRSGVPDKRFMQVTFPMTHASSSFEMFNAFYEELGTGASSVALRQDYDIYQQLELGVRALDLPVAVNTVARHLYGVHVMLTISLVRILNDVKTFINKYPSEVVVLDLKKATERPPHSSLDDFLSEEADENKLPGQMVHDLVVSILGERLATYAKLSGIGKGATATEWDNPKIRDLVAEKANVMYFWEGQLVLCTTRSLCQTTPGWRPPTAGKPFAFGPPLPLGVRAAVGGKPVLEPLCLNPSASVTASNRSAKLLHGLVAFSLNPRELTAQKGPPSCYPANTELPPKHVPPLVHRLDGYLEWSWDDHTKRLETFADDKSVYFSGEALTMRSDSERVNFMLLVWYLGTRFNTHFQEMNLVAFDFVHPVLVHRIISAVQGLEECSYYLQCVDTGSCFAVDLHGQPGEETGRKCLDRRQVMIDVKDYSEGRYIIGWYYESMFKFITWLFLTTYLVWYCIREPRGDKAANVMEEPGSAAADEPPPEEEEAAEPPPANAADAPADAADAADAEAAASS